MIRELLQLPNLMSIARILLIPFIGYYLMQPGSRATLVSVCLLVAAGITDFLDGYLARRRGQITDIGTALDPIADKLLAGALVVLLVLSRGFPVWLAAVILGRDILILAAGSVLLRKRQAVTPANLTGKYTFTSIAALLGSYILRFDFGMLLFTYLTVVLIAASLFNYGRLFVIVSQGKMPHTYVDRPFLRFMRVAVSSIVAAICAYELAVFLFR